MSVLETCIDAPRAVIDGAERSVTIGIAGGRIRSVRPFGTPLTAQRHHLLGEDVVLLPGLVDTHVHIDEPGHADWEGFATATSAAAVGGITTLVDMPLDSLPVTTTVTALETKRAAASGQSRVDVAFWGGIVGGRGLDDVGPLSASGVLGFKCFLTDSGLAEFPPVSPAELREAMRLTASLGVPCLVHAELGGQPVPSTTSYADFLKARPHDLEVGAVALVVDAVRATGAWAHIVHVSSAATLPLLGAARAEGLPITAETCPHYLCLEAEQVVDGATEFACCPPIRDAANADALWQALRDGLIDMVVSDHSPGPAAAKLTGDFGTAWGGISSLQVGLPVMWTEARRRGFALTDVVEWMASAPARLAGLPDRGRIAVGQLAHLSAFAPDEEWTIQAAELWHRQAVTPYAGATVRGVVRSTWLYGEELDVTSVPRGELIAAPPRTGG